MLLGRCGVAPGVQVTKGAPQVILGLAANSDLVRERYEAAVQELADRGFRSLGIATSRTPQGEPPVWIVEVSEQGGGFGPIVCRCGEARRAGVVRCVVHVV